MNLRSLARRPSPAIVISSAALFMSLGGVGYAAVSIPNNSVGTNQLKNNAVSYQKVQPNSIGNVRLANNGVSSAKLANGSVSYKKIQEGAVGTKRANLDQLQARLKSSCPAGSAVGAADNTGKVTCNSVLPAEYGTANNTAALSGTPVAVSSVTLPAGPSYLAFANPTITVTGGAANAPRVNVSCTLTAGSATVTRTVTVPGPAAGDTASASIPLQVAGPAGAAGVGCSASVPSGNALPATSATAAINAVAVASIN